MRVLVTGASGFVGSHIIAGLLGAGHDVRGLSRTEAVGDRRRPGAAYIGGVDVGDASTMTPAMFDGVDSVVHLVGIIQQARGGQTFQRIHVDGTRNVVERAQAAAIAGPFVYMSAIGAAADAPAEYSRTKFAAEELVRGSGLPYAILRPSIILGKDGEFAAQMTDLVCHGGLPVRLTVPVIPVPGAGRNLFQPVFVDDLVTCVLQLVAKQADWGRVYEIGGAERVTFDDLIGGFAAAIGVRKPLVHAPIALLRIAAAVMEAVLPRPPVTRDQLANLKRDNVTRDDITAVFGVQPLGFHEILGRMYPSAGSTAHP